MSHNTLASYYKTAFALCHHHKWDISSVENLVPFERDLYVDMLIAHQKEQQR